MQLDELGEIINQLKGVDGEDIIAMEERINLLKRTQEAIHRLLFVECFKLALTKRELGLPVEPPEKEPDEKSRFLADLNKFRPRGKQERERQLIAQEICHALFEVEKGVTCRPDGSGLELTKLWPMWLLGIYNRYKDMRLQDFRDPAIPSRRNFSDLPEAERTEWLKGVDDGKFELCALAAHELLEYLDRNRQRERWEKNHRIRPLWEALNELEPPLSWGEVLWHLIFYLTVQGERRLLRELDPYFPSRRRRCILCGKSFEVSKYNPGYWRCPSCSGKLRVQQWRERKRKDKSKVGFDTPIKVSPVVPLDSPHCDGLQ
jgi:DNA-directed RNA polymerase subunit RPC12/RpoP